MFSRDGPRRKGSCDFVEPEIVQTFSLKNRWLDSGKTRLDASSYAAEVIASRVLIEKLQARGIPVSKVSDHAERVFWPGRFKRSYTRHGVGFPFLMPRDVIMFLPEPRKFISHSPKNLAVEKNWLLITRSGSVGRCLIVGDTLKRFVLSDDLIRVVPRKNTALDYLYVFLNTWVGQALLTTKQYGATVKHLEPHQVADVQVPQMEGIRAELGTMICRVHRLRNRAQELMLLAQRKLYSEMALPTLDQQAIGFLGDEDEQMSQCFETRVGSLNGRLNASYHNPMLLKIESYLSKLGYGVRPLDEMILSMHVPPRFKRPYTNNALHGVRYLRPSDLLLIKHFERRYLVKSFPDCGLYTLVKGDILVVTDGTIGWASIVTVHTAKWYGSNNFARIKTVKGLDKGYLLAYLLCPYGQFQLKREIYGGVIDHLTEDQIRGVKVPIPPMDVQHSIGKLVIGAHRNKDEANLIEEKAILLLENEMVRVAQRN